MDKLNWFKFSPSSWMMGRIQRCSEISQARFMRLCCAYWNHNCEMMAEDAKLELESDCFDELIKNRVLYSDDEYVFIRFLDEQYCEIEKTSNKGKLYALKRWNPDEYNRVMGIAPKKEPIDTPMGTHSDPNAEKKREEKRRKEETREDKAAPFSFKESLIDLGASKDLVSDWLKVRSKKSLSNTATAFKALSNEFEKSGKPIDEILNKCCSESWGGFKASWPWADSKEETKTVKLKWGN